MFVVLVSSCHSSKKHPKLELSIYSIMNLFKLFPFLLLLFTKSYSQEFDKIRIDIDRAYGGNFSDYLYDIEYIPLETKKEYLNVRREILK